MLCQQNTRNLKKENFYFGTFLYLKNLSHLSKGCLIYYRPRFEDHYPFINCSMTEISGDRLQNTIQCNQKYQLPEFENILQCADGLLGSNIKYANGIRTDGLIPPHDYVPWITFNNVYTEESRIDAEKDIIKAVCDQIPVNTFC